MLRPLNIPPIPERKPIEPTKLDDFFFSPQEQIIKTTPVGGGGNITHPFQLYAGTDANDIVVRYGTIMDIAPTDVATDIALTDDATNYIFIESTLNVGGIITAASIETNTTGLPANADLAAYILIGNVLMASGEITAINQAITHSLRFTACGRIVEGESVTERGTYEFWGV
jgi:hypothetical protein